METLWQDLKYGARMLARTPGFTAVAVLTLALGIGANTAIFSVVNAVLLGSIPYKNVGKLANVVGHMHGDLKMPYPVSVPDAQDLQNQSPNIETASWFEDERTLTLTGREEPVRLHVNFVSPAYFGLLGVSPLRGRTFSPEENSAPGAHPLVVISYALWQGMLGGDEAVLGRQVELNNKQYTVIGILPPEFRDLASAQHETDVWLPFTMLTEVFPPRVLTERIYHFFGALVRLREGGSWEAAQAEVNAISSRLASEYPDSNSGYSMRLIPLREQLLGHFRTPLILLLGGAAFVLVIGCANVANLLLARATTRQGEMSLRLALGASRQRLVRQLMTEGFLLSLAASVLGGGIALWAIGGVVRLSGVQLPGFVRIAPDLRVLGFAVAVAFLTTVACTLAPAWRASRSDLRTVLSGAGRGAGSGAPGRLAQRVLLTAQVATALILSVGAGLLLLSFRTLHRTGINFETHNVLSMGVELPSSRYPDPEALRVFEREAVDTLESIPGVRSVHLWGPEIPGRAAYYGPYIKEGDVSHGVGEGIIARIHHVSAGSLKALGFRFTAGRDLSSEDRENTDIVAVISRSLAAKLWPNEDPLGRRFRATNGTLWYTVVGVIEDARLGGRITPDASNRADIFYSFLQRPRREVYLLIRGETDVVALAPAVRERLRAVDPNLPPYDVMTMDELLGGEETKLRFTAGLAAFFAGLAFFLTAVGLYAVLAYLTSRRTNEIGIRMALGAGPRDILWLVISVALRWVFVGVLVGLGCALALTRLLSSLLYGVTPLDPLVYACVITSFLVVAFWASFLPARRATRVDPLVALRYE